MSNKSEWKRAWSLLKESHKIHRDVMILWKRGYKCKHILLATASIRVVILVIILYLLNHDG